MQNSLNGGLTNFKQKSKKTQIRKAVHLIHYTTFTYTNTNINEYVSITKNKMCEIVGTCPNMFHIYKLYVITHLFGIDNSRKKSASATKNTVYKNKIYAFTKCESDIILFFPGKLLQLQKFNCDDGLYCISANDICTNSYNRMY